jgi:hypothetical protein
MPQPDMAIKSAGCANSLDLTASEFTANGWMTATIERKLNTGDAVCDKILTPGMNFKACFSYLVSSNIQTFDKHNHYGMGTLQLGTTQATSFWQTTMPAEFCSAFTCATSSTPIPLGGVCAMYNANPTGYPNYTTTACASGLDCSQATPSTSFTCITSMSIIANMMRYPGDKCGGSLIGNCVAGTICTAGYCVGVAIGGLCTDSNQCVVGYYCPNPSTTSVCTKQLAIGALGCMMDTDCVNTAGCNMIPATPASNMCVKTMSLAAGAVVGTCPATVGMNSLCMSGTCTTSSGVSYCTSTLKSQGSLPVKCYMDSHDCMSTADTSGKSTNMLQGMCLCSQSSSPQLYCSLQPGDSPMTNAMGYMMSWLESTNINNCSTVARTLPSYCASETWSVSKTGEYVYWALYSSNYA